MRHCSGIVCEIGVVMALVGESRLRSMLFLPSLDPRDNPLTIRVNLLSSFAVEFDHDLLVEGFSGFLG